MHSFEEEDANLSESERAAKAVLKGLGFTAKKIATTSARSADFDVSGDAPEYLVEVKSRLLDERLNAPLGQLSEPVTKLVRKDAKVGDWLASAKQQFAALDPSHEKLWFLWCSMEGPQNAPTQAERTISVLYGVQEALDVEPPHQTIVVFYAEPAAFERFPDIDGAVVVCVREGRATFCPNETSPRLATVMGCKLVHALRAEGAGAMLPAERAAIMNGYVVPPEMRGAGASAILRHVQEVFGHPYLVMMAGEVEYMQTLKVPAPKGPS